MTSKKNSDKKPSEEKTVQMPLPAEPNPSEEKTIEYPLPFEEMEKHLNARDALQKCLEHSKESKDVTEEEEE